MPQPSTSTKCQGLVGRTSVPGDKSISHRALIFGALATGRTEISGLLESADVLATAKTVAKLGAATENLGGGCWRVTGRGTGGLGQPDQALDFGNSGTAARLMLGVITGHDITVELVGDASLTKRPMQRVLEPLAQMGLEVLQGEGGRLPLTVRGTAQPLPITYSLPVASAQVKSAILLASLMSDGQTTVIEPEPTRDHTERLMQAFGLDIEVTDSDGGARSIVVTGPHDLKGRPITVPGDPSSAAFLVAAAVLVPGSELTIEGVLVNPSRIGFFDTLLEMGADIAFENRREEGGEPIADIRARSSRLSGVTVPAARAPSMIDEYPILAVISAFATGTTRMLGLAELKVKESDRLGATEAGLRANGVNVEAGEDSLTVHGTGSVAGGGEVATELDHRLAMAFLVMGLASEQPVRVDDVSMIETSFPDFLSLMTRLGAAFVSDRIDPGVEA